MAARCLSSSLCSLAVKSETSLQKPNLFVNLPDRKHDFCVKKGQRTSSTSQHERRLCPSHSSSSLLSVFWNPVLIWYWLVEDPVSPQRKWMKLNM